MSVMVGTDKGVIGATNLLTKRCDIFGMKWENLVCKCYLSIV